VGQNENGKEKGNKKQERIFGLLKIRNLIQIVFYLKIIQNIYKWYFVHLVA
jgi:hypothetical protein